MGQGKRMTRYIGLIDGTPPVVGVVIPDLPGCTSGGKTYDEACRNSIEAVRLWAEDALAKNESLPAPSTMDSLKDDPEIVAQLNEGAVFALIPLVLDSCRPARANVSFDAGLLEAIDEAAAERGLTRSAFLASAARAKIENEV
jgi:predicted RNase H-like HicB family nuclease